jgi:hypothetical protein
VSAARARFAHIPDNARALVAGRLHDERAQRAFLFQCFVRVERVRGTRKWITLLDQLATLRACGVEH